MVIITNRFPEDEPLQVRSIHHCEPLYHTRPEAHALEALAAEVNALGHSADDEREGLQLGAAGKHVLEVVLCSLMLPLSMLNSLRWGKTSGPRGVPAVSGNAQVPRKSRWSEAQRRMLAGSQRSEAQVPRRSRRPRAPRAPPREGVAPLRGARGGARGRSRP